MPENSSTPRSSLFLQHLAKRRIVFDGAMGTATHAANLDVQKDYWGKENCPEILVKSRPDLIQSIHESFLAVGADAVETDTFGGMPHVLAEFELQDQAFELCKTAAELARAACKKFATSDKPRFVAGSLGPGTKLITLGNIDWDAMFASYREAARGLIAGGADLFIIETCQDLLQIKCVINAVLAALAEKGLTTEHKPIMVSVTIENTGTMLLGTEIEAAAVALAKYPICSLGLNCATGPTEMRDHVKWLGKHLHDRAISVMPNAGLPILVDGHTEFPLKAEPFAQAMERFVVDDHVRIVGGCCGTKPEHIKRLVEIVNEPHARAWENSRAVVFGTGVRASEGQKGDADSSSPTLARGVREGMPSAVTSLYSAQDYRQDNSILIIGERMNASGSRAFKRLLEAEDWDGIVSLAREQVRHDGAHVLDINVDYAGRDNARDMGEVVRRVVRQVNIPLMLDSTQYKTIEAGLRLAGGKCIINSANFEDGEEKFDKFCELAKKFGAALVIGSIDEDKENSMARTADRKLAIAKRAYDRATKHHGLAAEDLLFDPLVLPISTGMESDRRSALETIEGVRLISKSLPDAQTTVGLSNVSFGLSPAARIVLNSAFLHELQAAGLTSAIIHFSKILPRNKIPDDQWAAALDLIYDRRSAGNDPLQRFIELFKDATTTATTKKASLADLSIEERLRSHIIDGEKEGLAETIQTALQKYKPLDIINDHLLDGMKTVGELFGSGKMQLPFVLQSAEVMKAAVGQLEPLMEKLEGNSKGSIVLATVQGDVHDIGKNLVDIILSNNGYTVHNIGIKQHVNDIIKAWETHKADAIGMSGLLVKSVTVMEENLRELNARGLKPRVLLGGAALTRHYCESHLRSVYQGEVFYGRDAFEGLRTMDVIATNDTKVLHEEIGQRLAKRSDAEEQINQSRIAKLAAASGSSPNAGEDAAQQAKSSVRSAVSNTNFIPAPPFFGTRVIDNLDLADIYPFINPIALFRGQWQVKKGAMSDAEYEAFIEDKIVPIFEQWKTRCRVEKILLPKVVYGYFACNSDGNDLVIWNSDDVTKLQSDNAEKSGANGESPLRLGVSSSLREQMRFTFPRQQSSRHLCISDYFRPISSGEVDVIGMHCVTMGSKATEEAQKLFKANDYTNYLYLHGLAVETAEALAEYWHKRMRQELGIATEDSPKIKDLFTQKYRGSRYSFGYPACPNLQDQEKLFALLEPRRIGCQLTENWQIDPEQSTSAIIVHHPEAKYFNV
ncbi:MAG: homocysteine S-methyltransferase family protein [Phycisphaerales bacterium]